jgi:hypothetical protein
MEEKKARKLQIIGIILVTTFILIWYIAFLLSKFIKEDFIILILVLIGAINPLIGIFLLVIAQKNIKKSDKEKEIERKIINYTRSLMYPIYVLIVSLMIYFKIEIIDLVILIIIFFFILEIVLYVLYPPNIIKIPKIFK